MKRFLLIDDNPDDRFLVIRHLRKEFDTELEITEIINMAQFEAALQDFRYDLVITDYRLRWTDGIQILTRIKERFPDCPVVMFTGTGNEEIAVQALKAGLDDYVLKTPQHYARLASAANIALRNAAQRRTFRELENRYFRMVENMRIGLFRLQKGGRILEANPALVEMLHYPNAETLQQTPVLTLYLDDERPWENFDWEKPLSFAGRLRCYDGQTIWADISVRRLTLPGGEHVFEGSARDISAYQEYTRYLACLTEITHVTLQASDRETIFAAITRHVRTIFDADSCYLTMWDEATQTLTPVAVDGIEDRTAYLSARDIPATGSLTVSVLQAGEVLAIPDLTHSAHVSPEIVQKFPARSMLALPLIARGKRFGMVAAGFHTPRTFAPPTIRRAADLAVHISLVFANAMLLQESQELISELEAVRQASLKVVSSLDQQAVLWTILEQIHALLEVDNAHVFLYDGQRLTFGAAILNGKPLQHPIAEPRANGITMQTIHAGQATIVEDASTHPLYANYALPFAGALAAFPLRVGGQLCGVLNVAYTQPHHFQAHEVRVLELLADQAAIAIQNANFYENTQRGYRRLQSLRTIDNAITASMDMNITLGVFLEQTLRQLNVHAAAIALYQPATTSLRYAMVRGDLPESAFPDLSIRLGTALCGKVALHKEKLILDTFTPQENNLRLADSSRQPVMYIGLPLAAKGNLQGVLEMYCFETFTPDSEWLTFADSLATQAAIAIENAQLFENLQRTNFNLELAYDQTLEGWARALELRGAEASGHSLRVVELCISFAQRITHDKTVLLNIRRGALLHDVGKMAVPDAILLKPGSLTDAEWEIMRQHPVYARQLLAPIHFLRDALDIPYAHHERWDGSGYPRGLSEERIPLAARIFALVDVWDSLVSERPYRAAWPIEKAYRYIQEQAGKLFDPTLTPVFLDVLQMRMRSKV
ncbi:MAG: hypothetical protein Fur0018_26080 [Anaerolineales bacterium]